MYKVEDIQTAFTGLVGINQAADPSYPRIDAALSVSSIGKFVNHPLCTMENIINAAPVFQNFDYPAYANGSTYPAGYIVLATDGKNYKAKVDIANASEAPQSTPAKWVIADPLSDFISNKFKQASVNMLTAYITSQGNDRVSKSLVQVSQMYQGAGTFSDRIIKQGRFVGIEIDLLGNEGLNVRMDKIGFQADDDQSELLFYLYHDSQTEPIYTMPVVVSADSTFSWSPLVNIIFGYLSNNTDAVGRFRFGYYEDDLSGQAIKRVMNMGSAPCLSCNAFDLAQYNAWSKYIRLRTFEVPASGLNVDNSLFDLSKVKYTHDTNYGINLSFGLICDISDMVIKNKTLFADMYRMQVELDFLNLIAFTTNMGAINEKTKSLAMAELDESAKSGSYASMYKKGLETFKFNLDGVNSACFPCDKRGKLTFRAI